MQPRGARGRSRLSRWGARKGRREREEEEGRGRGNEGREEMKEKWGRVQEGRGCVRGT